MTCVICLQGDIVFVVLLLMVAKHFFQAGTFSYVIWLWSLMVVFFFEKLISLNSGQRRIKSFAEKCWRSSSLFHWRFGLEKGYHPRLFVVDRNMASLHELVRQAEIGLFIVQYLGFCSAPILCNCARDVISSSCTKIAQQERQNAFEMVLGQGRVRRLRCAGGIALEGMLFQRACHQITDFIMRSWAYLGDGPILYPGLSEPSNHVYGETILLVSPHYWIRCFWRLVWRP